MASSRETHVSDPAKIFMAGYEEIPTPENQFHGLFDAIIEVNVLRHPDLSPNKGALELRVVV